MKVTCTGIYSRSLHMRAQMKWNKTRIRFLGCVTSYSDDDYDSYLFCSVNVSLIAIANGRGYWCETTNDYRPLLTYTEVNKHGAFMQICMSGIKWVNNFKRSTCQFSTAWHIDVQCGRLRLGRNRCRKDRQQMCEGTVIHYLWVCRKIYNRFHGWLRIMNEKSSPTRH